MKLFKQSRTTKKSTRDINLFPEAQHPDLPLSPKPPQARSPKPEQKEKEITRRVSVSDRFSSQYSGDRRSIAIEPGYDTSAPFSPDDISQPSIQQAGGLTRSQTVLRSEGTRRNERIEAQPSSLWSPDFEQLPATPEQPEGQREFIIEAPAPMYASSGNVPGKTSSDSGQGGGLDRWSQRRLQRLNTEQGFREQRSGGGQNVMSPTTSLNEPPTYNSSSGNSYISQGEQQAQAYQQAQPHPSQQPAYHSSRTGQASHVNAGLASSQSQSQAASSASTSASRSPYNTLSDSSQTHAPQPHQHFSPPDAPSGLHIIASDARPQFPARTHSSQQHQQISSQPVSSEELSMSNNGSLPAPKAVRAGNTNRQSMHNGLNSREAPGLSAGQNGGQQQQQQVGGSGGVPAFSASVVPPAGQSQAYPGATQQVQPSQSQQSQKGGDVGRITPQPAQSSEDMTEEDINQLIKDHKELREKYTKVKKYYFEKEDQVKQLQNSLAHQRLSQSRTSLDDSEYTTRFNRLDGLVAQLAFSIRKSWKSIPGWLANSVNKDAVATGKQEMTAAGRAFISSWLVDEVFDKYFHPDLEPSLSAQLKTIQRNIRRYAPPAQTAEEEEYLTAKVVNWRLSTLEGLQESLRSPQCPQNRARLTDELKDHLVQSLAVHLTDPPPSDLEGGVHMIIELVVSIAIHLPVESRDVQIDYFMPGYSIMQDQMKMETGIPPLTMSVAEDAAERGSVRSATSEVTDDTQGSNPHDEQPSKKRSMLSALTGSNKPKDNRSGDQRRHAGGSSSSLNRPDSSQGMKDQPPRVRMAAGIGVQIRQRSVLVKAPVFATS